MIVAAWHAASFRRAPSLIPFTTAADVAKLRRWRCAAAGGRVSSVRWRGDVDAHDLGTHPAGLCSRADAGCAGRRLTPLSRPCFLILPSTLGGRPVVDARAQDARIAVCPAGSSNVAEREASEVAMIVSSTTDDRTWCLHQHQVTRSGSTGDRSWLAPMRVVGMHTHTPHLTSMDVMRARVARGEGCAKKAGPRGRGAGEGGGEAALGTACVQRAPPTYHQREFLDFARLDSLNHLCTVTTAYGVQLSETDTGLQQAN